MQYMPFGTTEVWERRLVGGVRSLRIRHRLTQAKLTENANVPLSTVTYLESGRGSSLATFRRH